MTHPLGSQGAATAAAHANSATPNWSAYAYAAFCDYGKTKHFFTTEDARIFAESEGALPPPDKRAWGAIALKAKRAGLIKPCGFTPAKTANVHGNIVTLWGWVGAIQ